MIKCMPEYTIFSIWISIECGDGQTIHLGVGVGAVGSWLVNVSISENSTTAHARMRPT